MIAVLERDRRNILPKEKPTDRKKELRQTILYAREIRSIPQGHEHGLRKTVHPTIWIENGKKYLSWIEDVVPRNSDYADVIVYKKPFNNGDPIISQEVCRVKGNSGKILNSDGKPITPEETDYAIGIAAKIATDPNLPFI
ncbi:MAG: hypothetical protein M1268_00640 [Patescibacteria group bacterium]|nr:hypothetical protein [Patescibacteria group bacterium]